MSDDIKRDNLDEETENQEEVLVDLDIEIAPKTRDYKGFLGILVTIIAVSASLFHLYTAQFGAFFALTQRSIHWLFMSVLIFLLYPATKKASLKKTCMVRSDIYCSHISMWFIYTH